MKLRIGIFGVSFIFVCAGYGILTHVDPYVVVMLIWVAIALVLAGLFFVARMMHREGRMLREYDLALRQICPKCGYDLRATPERCPECGKAARASSP